MPVTAVQEARWLAAAAGGGQRAPAPTRSRPPVLPQQPQPCQQRPRPAELQWRRRRRLGSGLGSGRRLRPEKRAAEHARVSNAPRCNVRIESAPCATHTALARVAAAQGCCCKGAHQAERGLNDLYGAVRCGRRRRGRRRRRRRRRRRGWLRKLGARRAACCLSGQQRGDVDARPEVGEGYLWRCIQRATGNGQRVLRRRLLPRRERLGGANSAHVHVEVARLVRRALRVSSTARWTPRSCAERGPDRRVGATRAPAGSHVALRVVAGHRERRRARRSSDGSKCEQHLRESHHVSNARAPALLTAAGGTQE